MAKPSLLLLDEPSMGLAPSLVDQNARAALSVADRGYVLETGRVVLAGSGRELLADEKVQQAYLGL